MKTAVITLKEYQGFQKAYDFFNRELFTGNLPQVLVTLQRHANTRGYFSPERFKGRIDKQTVHELALNPDNFTGRSDELILSTLVHEMAHVWQQTYGEPPRRGYHNRGYALKAGQLTYDCRYSTMHGMPVTGGRGFRGLKPLWYNGVPP
jgi:hypothetical protein